MWWFLGNCDVWFPSCLCFYHRFLISLSFWLFLEIFLEKVIKKYIILLLINRFQAMHFSNPICMWILNRCLKSTQLVSEAPPITKPLKCWVNFAISLIYWPADVVTHKRLKFIQRIFLMSNFEELWKTRLLFYMISGFCFHKISGFCEIFLKKFI